MTPVPNSADWEVHQCIIFGTDQQTNILAMEIAIATEPPSRVKILTPNVEIQKAIERGYSDMFSPESCILAAVRDMLIQM